MNSLEHHLREKKMNEVESMNALQAAGVVSDLVVFVCDVSESDCAGAILYLTFEKSPMATVKTTLFEKEVKT